MHDKIHRSSFSNVHLSSCTSRNRLVVKSACMNASDRSVNTTSQIVLLRKAICASHVTFNVTLTCKQVNTTFTCLCYTWNFNIYSMHRQKNKHHKSFVLHQSHMFLAPMACHTYTYDCSDLELQIHKCNAAFKARENLGHLGVTRFTGLLETMCFWLGTVVHYPKIKTHIELLNLQNFIFMGWNKLPK